MSDDDATPDPAAMDPKVEWLTVAGDVDSWRSLGLTVTDDGVIPLVGTSIRLVPSSDDPGRSGIVGWALSGTSQPISVPTVPDAGTHATEIVGEPIVGGSGALFAVDEAGVGGSGAPFDVDGLSTRVVASMAPRYAQHPVGASGLDHVVVLTPDLERTSAAIADVTGCELKRVREVGSMRQGFHRIGRGGLIVELVERPELPDGPASFWGLVLIVDDLDAAYELIGPARISAPKDAVQPGRRIATISSEVGIGLPVALMTH